MSHKYPLLSTNCYAEVGLVHHSPPAAYPKLLRGNMRQLVKAEATVIHYEAGTMTLARDDVVNAVQEVIDGAHKRTSN